MKKGIYLGLLLIVLSIFNVSAQDCDSIYRIVESYLVASPDEATFVSDGQVYTAFLDNENAEFNTTLYGGTTYRVGVSAGSKDNYALFTIRDMDENILFTNKDHYNKPYWDFKVENTIPVKIQTELDTNKKITGCVIMMIGFIK